MKKPDKTGGCAFVVIGALFALIGAGILIREAQVACWPTTTGTLLAAEVEEASSSETMPSGASYSPEGGHFQGRTSR